MTNWRWLHPDQVAANKAWLHRYVESWPEDVEAQDRAEREAAFEAWLQSLVDLSRRNMSVHDPGT